MTDNHLAAAVKAVIKDWNQATKPADQAVELETPSLAASNLGTKVLNEMSTQGFTPQQVRQHILSRSHCHLQGVFDTDDLGPTPPNFIPVPRSDASNCAQAAALAAHYALGMETVSYGSENEGSLFVNLVAISDPGILKEKSFNAMRGHTDGVVLPFNGDDDPYNARLAPSPDVVTLLALRNPLDVPTTLMPLHDILKRLTHEQILELKKAKYSISPQRTFTLGMKKILGEEHYVEAAPILSDRFDGLTQIRFSHSNTITSSEDDEAAAMARASLIEACRLSRKEIIVSPGDLLIVNNRLSLHGRGALESQETRGASRWLLRTYGLDTFRLAPCKRRFNGKEPTHILFP